MIEQWLIGDETLIDLGFQGNDNDLTLLIPLRSLGVKAQTLQKSYHAKVIIRRIASGKVIASDVPVINHQGEPWAKWILYREITRQPGIITFQVRAVNYAYRLVATPIYRGIIFARI